MPLVGIYSAKCFDAFKQAMQRKERKLFAVLERLNVDAVPYSGEYGLKNINSPQDLKALV